MKQLTLGTTLLLALAAFARTDAPVAGPAPSTKPSETRPSDGRLEANIAVVQGTTIRFTVKNVSKEPLAIWSRACSWGHEVYFFEVVTENGSIIRLSEPPMDWDRNVPSTKELAPGEAFSLDFDLTRLNGWKPMQAAVTVRGIYESKNEFKGKADWPKLQNMWEGRLVTEPLRISFSSKPVTKDGLQVTLTLAKAAFAADEQPKFTVVFKNISDKPITLCDADFFWAWSIRFEDVARKGPWQLQLQEVARLKLAQQLRAQKADTIQPGKTLEVVVDLGGKDLLELEYVWQGEQDKPVAPVRKLAPGRYTLTLDIDLKAGGKQGTDYWTGQVTTDPVTFTISR